MIFKEALEKTVAGEKIKLEGWKGYIYWDKNSHNIMICNDDGVISELSSDDNLGYIYTFVMAILTNSNNWEIATSDNTSFLKKECDKTIVIINGSGGVGKDTFVYLVDLIVPTMLISSVDKVKEAASILGWDGVKNESNRKFLSDLKLLTTDYNDHSYNYIKEKIAEFKSKDNKDRILFIMIREPKEIERIKKDFGAKSLLITNDRVKKITSNMADANVKHVKYDYVIHNNGTFNDLKNSARVFLCRLINE